MQKRLKKKDRTKSKKQMQELTAAIISGTK
jgi:hypothetical protein